MQEISFEYFRGMEAEQYSFYRVPKVLFTADCFKTLSCEAKVLYGLMLDRMSLSVRNRWFDEDDRVYIIFTVEQIMELLGCGRQKAIKIVAELDTEKGIGLIEKKRLGLGKPNVIYVKNFMVKEIAEENKKAEPVENGENTQKYENQTSRSMEMGFQEVSEANLQKYENQTSGSMKTELPEVQKADFKKYGNQTSRNAKNELQEVRKSNCNKTDTNKTDFSDTNYNDTSIISNLSGKSPTESQDVMEKMETYRLIIRENISYECFEIDQYFRVDEVDELVELMVEVMIMPDFGSIWIAGSDKPVPVVKNRFMKLTHSHIEYVLGCLQKNTKKVGNIKAYLLTTLYNASLTLDSYFRAEVNHDMYGGN